MSVYVFVGPTLRLDDARAELDAVYCPPAAVGDVYRVASRRPLAIGIIDGFFERTASVWHKEVLWAMSEGIHVFGAASMGALRAAELADYGMNGVGQVFSAFHAGELEDDDEVAVAHADAEHDYRASSDAMVNIRATFAEAAEQRVVSHRTQAALEAIGKDLFYPDRSYERILREAVRAQVPTEEIQALRAWLPSGRRDVKREDALTMLRLMRERTAGGLRPKEVAYRFEHTHMWEMLQRECKAQDDGRAPDDRNESIFDELRLRGKFVSARRAALARFLALVEARQSGRPFLRDALQDTAESLRRDRGLLTADQFKKWLDENGLTTADVDPLVRDEARFAWVDATLAHESTRCLADHLRLTGEYAALRNRVLEKERRLPATEIDGAIVAPQGLDNATLWHWYFVQWLHLASVPPDIAGYAHVQGFGDTGSFRKAVLREYLTQ